MLDTLTQAEEIVAWKQLGSNTFSELLYSSIQRAFKFFGPYEVAVDDLPNLLSHMGFFGIQSDVVASFASDICPHSTFNFEETLRLADLYASYDQSQFSSAFRKCDTLQSGQLSLGQVIDLMTSLGMQPSRETCREVLGLKDAPVSSAFDFEQVAHLIATYRATEGFAGKEVNAVHDAFIENATTAVGHNGLVIKACHLLEGLLQMFGFHTASYAKKLTARFATDSVSDVYCDFRSFLILARRLHDSELSEYRALFSAADNDADGLIWADAAGESLVRFGYTPLPKMLNEFLRDVGLTHQSPLDFDSFVRLVRTVRHREGFLQAELEEYAQLFNASDTDNSDEIDSHELRKLLRYFGYNITLADVRALLKTVDVNGDGVLDFEELLRLLRFHRESELKRAEKVYQQAACWHNGRMDVGDISPALAELDQKPTSAMLDQILGCIDRNSRLSFHDFVEVLDKCRRDCAAESRKRAGWSDKEFQFLCQRFNKSSADATGRVNKGQFLWILMDLGIKIRTSEKRNAILFRLDEARDRAFKAGVDRKLALDPGDSSVTVWVFAHLLRLMAQGSEEQEEERDVAVREETRFSHSEVAEFSEIFTKLVESSSADSEAADRERTSFADSNQGVADDLPPLCPASHGSVLRALLGDKKANRRLPTSGLRELLTSLGVQPSCEQKQQLKSLIALISTAKGSMDFADFLRTMRWMIDTNFAGINSVTQQVVGRPTSGIVGRPTSGSAWQKPRVATNTVSIGLYWGTKLQQTPTPLGALRARHRRSL
jgi:Ca2+-binding EF-hand superfamily protein